ncbi:Lrp/AsnC family transcriptional regulator [Streptomyces sp. AK010]|uniref:Lrp/AsnC family transcriptional regulator n=1 Tax=Streptomyces sp. AK010 TaxID=2723074 RepID=UPI00161E3D79|nr:Lrp/AsnC family transcriptional regulator [Streptomyces sp. AK010]MBB6421136.1 DNA-binding Lrp family transcriptional regulator [Streptomyces sp. AK010]
MVNRPVDDIDLTLLRTLQADARAPISTLSQAAGVSRATAYSRLAQMRETGVIHSLTVCVDPQKVGLTISAVLLLKTSPDPLKPAWTSFSAQISAIPEVEYAADIAGEFDLLILARLRDTEHLRSFIDVDIRRIPGVAATRTLLVLHEVHQRSLVLPTQASGVPHRSSGLG